MRVLIVEDDRTAADFLAKALGEAGDYQTEIAGDGEAGFALASTQSFGVLIVDRMLPQARRIDAGRAAQGAGRSHAGADPERARRG